MCQVHIQYTLSQLISCTGVSSSRPGRAKKTTPVAQSEQQEPSILTGKIFTSSHFNRYKAYMHTHTHMYTPFCMCTGNGRVEGGHMSKSKYLLALFG